MLKKTKFLLTLIFIINFSCIYCVNARESKAINTYDITVIRHTNTSLKIKWKKDKDTDGYIIYRYKKANKGYVEVKRLDNDKTYWINKGLRSNTVYKYKIRAYKNVDGQINLGKMSYWVSGKTYNRHNKKINAKTVKVGSKQVNIGLCSFKIMKARVIPSKYGTNYNKEVFNKKIRWYSSDKSIATVDWKGKIQAKSKVGKCYVYAIAHNGKKTRITVYVKNYARQDFENYPIERDLYTLVTDYKDEIQKIAEYYSVHRLNGYDRIRYTLDDNANVSVQPQNTEFDELKETIEKLLVYFPYYIDIDVHSDFVDFIVKMEDTDDSLKGLVSFYFDYDCSDLTYTCIAPHWNAWRFYPD